MLLKEAIGEFLTYLLVELNRSRATCEGYEKDLHIFTAYLESGGRENITLEELTPELLSGYLRHLTRERGNQANTVRRRITALKSFCAFLVENAYLEHNPAANLPRPRIPQKQPRHLQQAEVEKLFAAVPEDESPAKLRDKTVLMFMYYSGVRVSELVNMRREDADLNGGFIRVVRGKGGRFRKVPLHGRLQSQLEKYLSGAPELVGDHLFCNRQGCPISTDYVHHMLGEYAEKAGIAKKVTPHMLRHSFATHLYREEVDINTLGKLLGHAGIRTTAVYTHTDLKHLRAAVNLLHTPVKLEKELFITEEQHE
ncbi:MAG: site-specific tyrosine recombinase/integron integrase [Bacillota bacterium]